MAKRQRIWVCSPQTQPRPKVPETIKTDLEVKAGELVESILKPLHVKPPRKDEQFNYIVDIYSKWYRNYFTSAPGMPALVQMPFHHTLRPNLPVWNMLAMNALILRT